MFPKAFPYMNLRTLIEHSPSPFGSSTNEQPYHHLPYQDLEDNGLTRIGSFPLLLVSLINNYLHRRFNKFYSILVMSPPMYLLLGLTRSRYLSSSY